MPINLNQHDDGFRPLNGFLFKCDFLADENIQTNIGPDILKILGYSVSKLTLPKFNEYEGKPHSFGSFFIPFPYFSTGEKEMTIEFYETDDMLISKVFYSFLNRYRWRASTIFDVSQADFRIEVSILDQRNLFGYDSDRPLLRKEYYLKTKSIEPPQFARDGSDTDLCRVSVTFNTIESKYSNVYYGRFGSVDEINKRFDSEKNKYVDVVDDNAFLNSQEVVDKLSKMFADLWKKDNTLTVRSRNGVNPLFGVQSRIDQAIWLDAINRATQAAIDRGSEYGHNKVLNDKKTDCSELGTEILNAAGQYGLVEKYGTKIEGEFIEVATVNSKGEISYEKRQAYRLDTDAFDRMLSKETNLFQYVDKKSEDVKEGDIFNMPKAYDDSGKVVASGHVGFITKVIKDDSGKIVAVETAEARSKAGVGYHERKITYLRNERYDIYRPILTMSSTTSGVGRDILTEERVFESDMTKTNTTFEGSLELGNKKQEKTEPKIEKHLGQLSDEELLGTRPGQL